MLIDLKTAIRIGALLVPVLALGDSGNDGVVLDVGKGPSANQVTLTWSGGSQPYAVYRSTLPADVESSLSFVGSSAASPYVDTPPVGQAFYYFVQPTCVADTNPACANYINVGNISGDLGSGAVYWSGTTETWLRVNLIESTSGDYDLSAMIFLYSPPGSDFDLYVRCLGCSGATNGWSFEHSLAGHTDSTFVLRRDSDRIDSYPILIEVRAYQQNSCGTWQLSVVGNTGGPYETCSNP
jgi:hypothetical protein